MWTMKSKGPKIGPWGRKNYGFH